MRHYKILLIFFPKTKTWEMGNSIKYLKWSLNFEANFLADLKGSKTSLSLSLTYPSHHHHRENEIFYS